jgi:hypothetical protein
MFVVLLRLIVFIKMLGVQEISMANSYESKLDVVLKAIEALTVITRALKSLASGVGTSQRAEIPQPMQHVAVEGPTPLPSQGNNCSNQNLDGGVANFRKSKINLLEKLNSTQLKFRGFVNQLQLITIF